LAWWHGDNENLSRVCLQADDFTRLPDHCPTKTWHDGRVIAGQDFGGTLRVILPIGLDTGDTVPFEVWVVIDSDDLSKVASQLDPDGWTGQTCRGVLLNAVEPWPEHPVLKRVLSEKWPRRTVVATPL
jgi:hypothetical protein